ncbi:hypothetical protein FSP39_008417 [Pinctada imbricata]|uniref:Receptor expression-enhancing protein n=1 Tax=Pinctada imbricata TaxID=66713 RepID=A0AA89BYB3_PINIB|nr:hypothetical protein FSP39_008417 [Pinctada imbricata]
MTFREFVLKIVSCISPPIYVFCRLFFGTLYPAYASYKAIRTKNVKEYVKWMMYWIVFALFCFVETFADVLLSWLPFYYEVKIIFVIWMLSPITRGSSFLYKKFVHPHLLKREKEIDEYIAQYSKKGYSTLMQLGTKGLSYATNVVVNTAIKGQTSLADHIRKSYSTNDLRVPDDSVDGDSNIRYIDDDDDLDYRLAEDNREIERRKGIRRTNSDASELRPSQSRYSNTPYLSSVEEAEEEEREDAYVRAGYKSPRHKSDPYATLPRTRARTRSKLPR